MSPGGDDVSPPAPQLPQVAFMKLLSGFLLLRAWLARRRLVRQRKLLEVRARKRATIARESRKVYCVEAHREPEVSC